MGISEQEQQQTLESIERHLASTGPELASMLTIFARLTAGEEMPAGEQVRRPFDVPRAAGGPARRRHAIWPACGPGTRRPRLRKPPVWMVWLLWPVVTITLIAWALALGHGAGRAACPVTRTAACQQVPAPAGPGNGEQHREQPAGGQLSQLTAGFP